MTAIPWTTFLPAALLVSIVPGANQLLGLRHAARHGLRPALVGLTGRLAAFTLLMVLAAVGLGAVLTASVVVFETVRWVGVAYLAGLGIVLLWRVWRHDDPEGPDDEAVPDTWSPARREFLVAVTNPKALLLFVAFLPQFVPAGAGSGSVLVVLGGAYVGVEACSAVLYVALGRRIGVLGRRARRRLDALTGVSFVGLAGALVAGDR